jgi:hypothetical protein
MAAGRRKGKGKGSVVNGHLGFDVFFQLSPSTYQFCNAEQEFKSVNLFLYLYGLIISTS